MQKEITSINKDAKNLILER